MCLGKIVDRGMRQAEMARSYETMRLWKILQKSLTSYRANIVLFVPSLVGLIAYFLYSVFPGGAILLQALESESSDGILSAVWLLVGIELSYWTAGLLVDLGSAVMTGRVVLGGKAALSDWMGGTRQYFFRVLGIILVYNVIVRPLDLLMNAFAMRSLTAQGLFGAPLFLMSELSGGLLFSITVSMLYLWLASAILDDNGVWGSLIHGTNALKNSGRTYVGFVLMLFAVSATERLANCSNVQRLAGSLTSMGVLTGVVLALVHPLWFLMAFEMYRAMATKREKT